jgi:hypothetical protein
MKTTNLLTALTIILAVNLAQGAHLTYYDGGMWGQTDRYINDSDREVPSEPLSNAGTIYCGVSNDEETDYSWAEGSIYGEVMEASYWGPGKGTAVYLNAFANCESDDPTAEVWTYGTIGALVPAYTDGIFYVVEADEDENTGDPVKIEWHWDADCTMFYGDAQASASGSATIYLTRNAMPPTGLPPSGIMWSREGVTFDGEDWIEDSGSFEAQIGDVIGVFFGAGANANLEGVGSSGAQVNTTMELLAAPTLIEYSYAPGLVYDADQNITFLKDWSAASDYMNWEDANAWAENFTYESNGITYSNWRLPRTIDSGGAVGEMGYLYTHYGISADNQGPFINIYGGDYWEAPQFGDTVYTFTFDTFFGPAQYGQSLDYEDSIVIPVFDGPPTEPPPPWCPADFNNDGIVDFKDFAIFASYWLAERP